jgi:transcription termination factor NusB
MMELSNLYKIERHEKRIKALELKDDESFNKMIQGIIDTQVSTQTIISDTLLNIKTRLDSMERRLNALETRCL